MRRTFFQFGYAALRRTLPQFDEEPFYPDPALRVMGDIDLLVKLEQQAAAANILLKDGYCKNTDESHPFHVHLSKEQIAVEIHREPNGIYLNENTAGAQELRRFFDDAIERRQYIDGLPVLADDQQAVVLLLHKLGSPGKIGDISRING